MTEFLISGRQTGKSTAALRWLRGAGNRQLVVPDSRQVDYLARMDREYAEKNGVSRFYLPDKIIPYASLGYGRHMPPTIELGVDNLDIIISHIFKRSVGFVTATGSLYDGPLDRSNTIYLGGSA